MEPTRTQLFDEDALLACVDLVGRSGATGFKVEYTADEPAKWWCEAFYKGARLFTETKDDPGEAADALARRILTGGACTHCGLPVAISDSIGTCRWRRMGPRWERGCIGSHPGKHGPNRAARRRKGRK